MIETLTLPTVARIAELPSNLRNAFTALAQDLIKANTGFEVQKALGKFDAAVAN